MSVLVRCPACPATLRIPPDSRGRAVRCPRCGHVLPTRTPPTPPAPPRPRARPEPAPTTRDEPESDRPPRRRTRSRGRLAALAAALIGVVGCAVGGVLLVRHFTDPPPPDDDAPAVTEPYDAPFVDPPEPTIPPDAPIPESAPEPPPTLADTGRSRVVLTGDPADPTFAGRTLSEWRADLRPPPNTRHDYGKLRRAHRAMECYGPHAAVAVHDLLTGPTAPDAAVWKAIGRRAALPLAEGLLTGRPPADVRAQEGLRALGPDAAPALARLVALADHPSARVRLNYPSLLGPIGPAARPAVPKLVQLLKGSDLSRRYAAAEALMRIDPAVGLGIPVLLTRDSKANSRGLELPAGTVKTYGPRLTRPLLAAAVGPDGKGPLRADPVYVLPRMKEHAANAVPELIRLAKERPAADAPTLLHVVEQLVAASEGRARREARRRVPELLALAADADPGRSFGGLRVLAHCGPAAGPVGRHAGRYFETGKLLPTCRALAEIGPSAGEAIPALLERAAAPRAEPGESFRRSYALFTAARLGAKSADLLPAALALSRDQEARPWAIAVLRRCGREGAARADEATLEAQTAPPVPNVRAEYLELAADQPTDPAVLRVAAAEFQRAGVPLLPPFVSLPAAADPALEELARGADVNLAQAAALALFVRRPADDAAFARVRGRTGADVWDAYRQIGAAGVPRLVELLRGPDGRGSIAPGLLLELSATVEVPAAPLAAALGSDPQPGSAGLLIALGRCGERARPHLDVARTALRSTDTNLSFAAAQVLAALDPADRSAVPLLIGFAGVRGGPNLSALVRPAPKPEPPDGSSALPAPPVPPSGQPRYWLETEARRVLFELDPAVAVTSSVFDEPVTAWKYPHE